MTIRKYIPKKFNHLTVILVITLVVIFGISCSPKFENKVTTDNYSKYKTVSSGKISKIKVFYKEGPLKPQRWTSDTYFDYLGSAEYYEDLKIIKKIIQNNAYFYNTIHSAASSSYRWDISLETTTFKFNLLRDKNTMMKHIMPYNLQGIISDIPPGEYFIEFYLEGELVNKDWFKIMKLE